MDRTQFTFYESFFKAISRIRKKSDRADAYDAICAYALYGAGPDLEKMPDSAAIAFELSKPNLDASRKKANSGKRGGKAKQTESKPEAKRKQEQTGSKKENEIEIESEIENECLKKPSPDGDGGKAALAAVMTAYMDKISPTPSQSSLDELKGYVESMGAECCLRAIDESLNAGKVTWNYIRGILRAKASQGVRCIADWDRLENGREAAKQKKREQNLQPACDRDPVRVDRKAMEDMERTKRLMERMREAERGQGQPG